MTHPRRNLAVNSSLIIDGRQYELDPGGSDPAYTRELVETQPASDDEEFERRILNLGTGWGNTRGGEPGTYDYADTAVLHKRNSFLPGSAVTDRTHNTTPLGPVSFVEYWDGTQSNARLVAISPRHVYEYDSDGDVDVADLGSGYSATTPMTRGVLFKNEFMSGPKIYIARRGTSSTHYMVERTGAGTYAASGNQKRAEAIGKGKDDVGDSVLWRITEDGLLNAAVGTADPSDSGAWAGASTSVGDTSARANDIMQQARAMVVGREDGAFTFDNVSNSIPITVGMRQTIAPWNFRHLKDFNGMAIGPTAQGLVWLDGLEWGVCGPVSSNPEARNLRGQEVAVSDLAGRHIYCAVLHDDTSYIFMGTPRLRGGDTGDGPLVWHGPVASIDEAVTDLHVSTVWGTKLWIGYNGGWATLDLEADYSPKTDAASGKIYLGEALFDLSGPGIIKDFRKAEFIAPAGVPFSSTNQWTLELQTGPSTWTAINGGAANQGVTVNRWWSTETSAKRIRARLSYSENTGAAELEAVIVRGTMRPEKTDQYQFRILLQDGPRMPRGNRLQHSAAGTIDALVDLSEAGRKALIVFGEAKFHGRVTSVREVSARVGKTAAPRGMALVTVRRTDLD